MILIILYIYIVRQYLNLKKWICVIVSVERTHSSLRNIYMNCIYDEKKRF